ncbi:transcription factor IIIB 70 kDa subunit (B-related factor) [Scheffersomyces coipomensis]|uniref:transcription factor IIIB 70 kDa subunit (B-related factor) n=1 Tax=Scheffersomyces coipomensis TaxID=1788519 RepID=UPI00315D3980
MSVKVQRQQVCSNCKHANLIVDRYTAAGDISCSRCGTVQVENPIVSEVQFGESSSGAAMVQGAMVGHDQARASYGGNRQNAMESREQTILNGKRKIRRIAAALKIPDYIAESAGAWFKLALTQNFVQGRRSQNVLAACLYVACRKEKTHHMLIDFSSRLQISVYSLGATFLKMVKALNITQLPISDPSLFIQHFAEKLDFKDQLTKVVKDAVKLSHRMSDDWIREGRRPAGIAGACVLLAARMNNFRRSHAEIVAVSHVGQETLQRRLNEFKKTKSGDLTVQDFRETEITEQANPPSFDKNRRNEHKLIQQVKEKEARLERLQKFAQENKLRASDEELKTMLEENPAPIPDIKPDEDGTNTLSAKELQSEIKSVNRAKLSRDNLHIKEEGDKDMLLRTILRDYEVSEDIIAQELERILNRKKDQLKGSVYQNPSELTDPKDKEKSKVDVDKPRNLHKLPTTSDVLSKVSSSVELTEDDDDEIVLESELTDKEKAMKERIWTGLNHDFIIEQERKRLKEEADELTGNTSGANRKKKQKTNAAPVLNDLGVSSALASIEVDEKTGEPLTAADSAKLMLSKKSFSKKINYATLGELFPRSGI